MAQSRSTRAPLPASDFASRVIELEPVESDTIWWRIHPAGASPLWFGPAHGHPPRNRFDDPEGEYRVCYLGTTPEASFAETFLRNPPVPILSRRDLAARVLTAIRVANLRLAPLYGEGLARIGTTAAVASGSYTGSRAWSRAIWSLEQEPDGIYYRSRHDDSQLCVALFDRAAQHLEPESSEPLLDDPVRLAAWLRRYEIGLTD